MVLSLKNKNWQHALKHMDKDLHGTTISLLARGHCTWTLSASFISIFLAAFLVACPSFGDSLFDVGRHIDVSGSFCTVLQSNIIGDGPHETQGSAKIRLRMDIHIVPEHLDFVLRFQNAAGKYFLGPGQIYPVNNISIDKPDGGFFPKGNALVDYAYLSWRPAHNIEFALGVFEPWTYDMGTRDGMGSFLNGVSDCGGYLNNLHFFTLGAFKPSVINLFRSLPALAVRFDPVEDFRFRGFAMTTQVEKFGLFNPEWELSKHLPDYTSYFFELEYRGDLLGKASSFRLDFGWVDALHVSGLRDPDHYGFNWGIILSQRLMSDHFSVNAFYYYSDDTLANRLVNFVRHEESLIFTFAWGGNASPANRFYNYLCQHLVHVGVGKANFYRNSFIPVNLGRLKAMTPVIKDEYAFEMLYVQRMENGFSWNLGFQVIKNPAAGHEDWMVVPELGLSANF